MMTMQERDILDDFLHVLLVNMFVIEQCDLLPINPKLAFP